MTDKPSRDAMARDVRELKRRMDFVYRRLHDLSKSVGILVDPTTAHEPSEGGNHDGENPPAGEVARG